MDNPLTRPGALPPSKWSMENDEANIALNRKPGSVPSNHKYAPNALHPLERSRAISQALSSNNDLGSKVASGKSEQSAPARSDDKPAPSAAEDIAYNWILSKVENRKPHKPEPAPALKRAAAPSNLQRQTEKVNISMVQKPKTEKVLAASGSARTAPSHLQVKPFNRDSFIVGDQKNYMPLPSPSSNRPVTAISEEKAFNVWGNSRFESLKPEKFPGAYSIEQPVSSYAGVNSYNRDLMGFENRQPNAFTNPQHQMMYSSMFNAAIPSYNHAGASEGNSLMYSPQAYTFGMVNQNISATFPHNTVKQICESCWKTGGRHTKQCPHRNGYEDPALKQMRIETEEMVLDEQFGAAYNEKEGKTFTGNISLGL